MPMHILLVEDHADLAASVEGYLAHFGHTVRTASDGLTAVDEALSERYDAVVLDRKLPHLDGASVCRRLRAESRNMPILMLTALDTLEDRLSGFEAGADDYLVKPFALAELHARLASLHRRETRANQIVRVDSLTYDFAAREGNRNGRPLALSPTGRILLEQLLKAQGRVVTRTVLEQAVWEVEQKHSGLLRVHMHAVRATVDRDEKIRLIHTHSGIGYRLGVDAE